MSTKSPYSKRILLGVAGGIAAYKTADLCSKLAQNGHQVQVVMTDGATQFVGEATFAALSGRPVVMKSFDSRFPLGPHIELAKDLDAFIVAPATASVLARFAGGLADDLLSTLYLQNTAPVWLVPAMSDPMWRQPSVQRNVAQLAEDGCQIIGPESGWLSCRIQGIGRMSEPAKILQAVESTWASS